MNAWTLNQWMLFGLCVAVVLLLLGVLLLLLRRPERELRAHRDQLEQALREEQREGRGELRQQLDGMAQAQAARIAEFGKQLDNLAARTDQRLEGLRNTLGEDARKTRQESSDSHHRSRESLDQRLRELTQRNEQRMGEMRATLEGQLKSLQTDNAAQLEKMRATVDEKLQSTLETRLGQSFKLVSERLEAVQRGLGEMQNLAAGVGDLKRVLTNVKSRGVFGEVQLAALLEQVLTPEQYLTNVATVPGSNERVEFAVRMPGGSDDSPCLLPMDAKFPREDYERLLDAQERADAEAAQAAGDALERRIREEAKTIRGKYLSPPATTDFAILFLPTEGLYAEVIRRPGLFEALRREHQVTVAGPTTLSAILSALQMGFRTLAIEKRSSEVWKILAEVKNEYAKFGAVLDKTRKQLDTVRNSIDSAGRRNRAIERKLRDVETMPDTDNPPILAGLPSLEGGDDEADDEAV